METIAWLVNRLHFTQKASITSPRRISPILYCPQYNRAARFVDTRKKPGLRPPHIVARCGFAAAPRASEQPFLALQCAERTDVGDSKRPQDLRFIAPAE